MGDDKSVNGKQGAKELESRQQDASEPGPFLDNGPTQAKLQKAPCRKRANSLPPARRRSARLNCGAHDGTVTGESSSQTLPDSTTHPDHRPAQPTDLNMPATPTQERRRTISSIIPGGSSPLSDAPTQPSSPSRIFDGPSLLRSSSPLSDPPSHLGISSPFFERRAFGAAAFPSSSSLLSDPPSHLASSPHLNHLAPQSSSPLSEPPVYLPSSPPLAIPRSHLPSLQTSSPLSSPPQFILNPYRELRPRRSAYRDSSPTPQLRAAASSSRDSSGSNSSSTHQSNSSEVEESSQTESYASSQQSDLATSKQDCEAPSADEIHCAPNPPTPLKKLSQEPPIEPTQSQETEAPQSSQPFSSQGSASARLPLPNIKGRDLFDASIWACPVRTSVFYTFATTLRQKVRDVVPTSSHLFIGQLRDRGKLVRCYTQNIDRIEEKVGLSTALDRGPGHRSRFSRRAPALSRGVSGASDAAAADCGLLSSGPSGKTESRSLNGMPTHLASHLLVAREIS